MKFQNRYICTARDTLRIKLGPKMADHGQIPEICRNEVIEWDREIKRLGEVLSGLMCEGLGVETWRLKEMTCLEDTTMLGHYYPKCPQPDLTVKYGEDWVDVKPVPGTLIINVGDLLQIISNEVYKSAEHRVLANSSHEPRVSIAVFFNAGNKDDLYGPLPELISSEKPALYRQFTMTDFRTRFSKREVDGFLSNYYKL
uniref:Isopenicillin N synthase-like Fe(2+) 2OG dioxygenase domain-containing protein n=1 Tax=Quercus lobata TaxID=97700 RepID=A0A7N2L8S0_QUELO